MKNPETADIRRRGEAIVKAYDEGQFNQIQALQELATLMTKNRGQAIIIQRYIDKILTEPVDTDIELEQEIYDSWRVK